MEVPGLAASSAAVEAARQAIVDCVRAACAVPLDEALELQSRHSGQFMVSDACRSGAVGQEARRTLVV